MNERVPLPASAGRDDNKVPLSGGNKPLLSNIEDQSFIVHNDLPEVKEWGRAEAFVRVATCP